MDQAFDTAASRACWFVGATQNWTEDLTPEFVEKGIWRNGYENKYLDLVKSMREGDRIAIKSSYVRKNGLPFDNKGLPVSVMAIKATGTITENPGDGRSVKVDWTRIDPPREWYFYTHRGTIWKVSPVKWENTGLIDFAFNGKEQDIDRFRNAPYWHERFGDKPGGKTRFGWTRFYEAIADGLLRFKDDRRELVNEIHAISGRVQGLSIMQDQFSDGSVAPLRDICPFTVIGTFNRGITDENRKAIAQELANFLGVAEPVPRSFEGIPILNNQRSWFYGYERRRQPQDIDILWNVFAEGLRFPDESEEVSDESFIQAYNEAIQCWGVKWNLTMGLYWIRPWSYLTLDGQSQRYIEKKLGMQIGKGGPKNMCGAEEYLRLIDILQSRFQEEAFPAHSFPELSLAAWKFKDDNISKPTKVEGIDIVDDDPDEEDNSILEVNPTLIDPYSVDDIIGDGSFLEREALLNILKNLESRKNVILQGPPGTGKTWLAKRLAHALIGQRDETRVKSVQFHPNLSYEDFIRGWRPSGNGTLMLIDGPLLEMVESAKDKPSEDHVLVIEEINRGNPAQIFGEMLTLLEADKRTPSEAMQLCHRKNEGERVYVPGNLYIIGTMNIADRSLALVDYALRRRFAFIDLQPVFGARWREWLNENNKIEMETLVEIERNILRLNEEIAADPGLGAQFRVGHSYVTPARRQNVGNAREWYRQVVHSEIGPLLEEYWYDDPGKAGRAKESLLEGF